MAQFFTISDASRLLGKPKNRKLIRRLLALKKIKTFKVGNSVCIDQDGFKALRAAVEEWDTRIRLTDLAATA